MYPQLAQLCMIPKAPALAGPLYALFSNSWFCIKNSWENACNSLRGLGIRENDGPTARMRVDRKLVGPRLSVSVFRSQAVASVPTPCGPNRTSLHMRIRHPTPTAPTHYPHLAWIVCVRPALARAARACSRVWGSLVSSSSTLCALLRGLGAPRRQP